jgi:hypothetical protein
MFSDYLFLAMLEQVRNTLRSLRRRNKSVWIETELAGQIASGRSERQNTRARQEMIERLLLNGIDTEPARAAIGEQLDPSSFGPANEAQSPLAIAQFAGSWAHIALHPAVVQRVPVAGFDDRAV